MDKTRIRVERLQIGMYVVELDRPWLGTSFLFQGFPITAQSQIDEIRKICKFVTVDPERMKGGDPRRDITGPLVIRGTASYPVKVEVEKEMPHANGIYDACEAMMRENVQRLRLEGTIDSKALKESVGEMTESVVRNPDAMTLLAKLKTKGDYEFARAVETSVLMIAFGRFLQLTRDQLHLMGLSGILLDIGKIKVPDRVLEKKGMLTPEEYEIAKKHVVLGVEIIRKEKELPKEVADVVMQHHERQDGSGYPRGLRGAEISLYGSIAGCVDSYSALISARHYAEQMAPSNALGTLYKLRGTMFHEALIEQFIQCIGIYPVGSAVELNTGEIGVVIAQNLVRRLQPRVMVVLDRDRNPLRPQKVLDLLKEPRATANETYRIRRTLPAEGLPVDLRDFFL